MGYEKPVIIVEKEISEGVYASSGTVYTTCASQYMNGVYQAPTGGSAGGGRISTGDYVTGRQLGCQGCPADRNWMCKINEGTYSEPPMPTWEKKGHSIDEQFTYDLN